MWEQSSGKKKPKWLGDTLKEAQEFGTPREPVRAIQMPDRLGSALVASLRDSEPLLLRRPLNIIFGEMPSWKSAIPS